MKFLFIFLPLLLNGCSFTYSPVDNLGEGKYKITTYGNAFSTSEDLQEALKEKAVEVCGTNQFEFLQNELKVSTGDVYVGGPVPISMTSGTVYAIVQCLNI